MRQYVIQVKASSPNYQFRRRLHRLGQECCERDKLSRLSAVFFVENSIGRHERQRWWRPIGGDLLKVQSDHRCSKDYIASLHAAAAVVAERPGAASAVTGVAAKTGRVYERDPFLNRRAHLLDTVSLIGDCMFCQAPPAPGQIALAAAGIGCPVAAAWGGNIRQCLAENLLLFDA